MQAVQELEPIVRIRDLKKDSVNFTLENVDLGCAVPPVRCLRFWTDLSEGLQIRFAG